MPSYPYSPVPLEESPRQTPDRLFTHSLVTAFYRAHRRVIDPKDRLILDVGCGSGYKTLTLAEANPGARIVGIDGSAASLEEARQRLQYHGFNRVEFHALPLEDILQGNADASTALTQVLGPARFDSIDCDYQFDYINCDDLLYLQPDPVATLRSLRPLLKPDGILRANLHSLYQRQYFFQAQSIFEMLGLMENPQEEEIGLVLETMRSLKPTTALRGITWNPIYEQQPHTVLEHFLLKGDRGYTVPDLFQMVQAAELEFVSMVNAWQWDFHSLFQDPANLPAFWQENGARFSPSDYLCFFELLHPVHALIDFWCAASSPAQASTPADWDPATWQQTTVYLHPHLRTDSIRQTVQEMIQRAQPVDLGALLQLPDAPAVPLESHLAACLLPLWDAPQAFSVLVDRYLELYPRHPLTLEPTGREGAIAPLQTLLTRLEQYEYVLLESP